MALREALTQSFSPPIRPRTNQRWSRMSCYTAQTRVSQTCPDSLAQPGEALAGVTST
jgi:hypothetical protein